MKYQDFEKTLSVHRLNPYRLACGSDTRKAMTLYRLNLKLSQELFTIISCFEVSLRNTIDEHFLRQLGAEWLKTAARRGQIFDNPTCFLTQKAINDAVGNLGLYYSHGKLVAELGFGFWRYLFASYHFRATGSSLLAIFPAKPTSSAAGHFNQKFFFNQLAQLNDIRNRIAHHEPICFETSLPIKNTKYARQHYRLIFQLFQWMGIEPSALLYGLDHVERVCDNIDGL